jgi:hypothetical protein
VNQDESKPNRRAAAVRWCLVVLGTLNLGLALFLIPAAGMAATSKGWQLAAEVMEQLQDSGAVTVNSTITTQMRGDPAATDDRPEVRVAGAAMNPAHQVLKRLRTAAAVQGVALFALALLMPVGGRRAGADGGTR